MSYHSGQDPEDNLPDWLKDIRKRRSQQEDQPPSSEGEHQQEPREEEPNWLREIRTRYAKPATEPEATEDQEPKTPLSDTQPVPSTQKIESTNEAEPEPETSEVTPALERPSEESQTAEEPTSFEELAAYEQAATGSLRREFPEWLRKFGQPKREPEEPKEQDELPRIPAFTEGSEELAPGELPSWLEALRPSGVFPKEDARSGEMLPPVEGLSGIEQVGPLAGLSGVLPAEPTILQRIKQPMNSARLELTDSQSQHVEAFKRMIEEEGRSEEVLSRPSGKTSRWLNTIIGAALFLAVLIPLASQSLVAAAPVEGVPAESQAVFDSIEGLPIGASVMLVFDVQPALYGETKAAAGAVLGHLLDKQAGLAFISTQPTGPALAKGLLQEVTAARPRGATSDTINLGYLSGGTAALRSFLNDPRSATFSVTALGLNPWTNPILVPIHQGSDFAMVLVFTGSADDARTWIEQGVTELPHGLMAITSAQAAPLLQPYLQSRPQTLQGMVSGLEGAAFYEGLRAQAGAGQRMWSAYSFGLGTIVVLILLGALFGRMFRVQSRGSEAPRSRSAN